MPEDRSGNAQGPPPESPSDLLGRTLGSHRVLEKIGEGGMGAVFRAHDTGLDRVVAIKVLPPALAHDEQHRVRFLREARALARVKHPNLVPIYAVSEEHGVYYFAMEFVEGESLRKRIGVSGPMELREMLRVSGQVLSALAAVHAAGITHRDVKSSNIMLERTGRAVLMDLGLAKDESAQGVTTAGVILGTPEFMSPEQAEGVPATPLSDIYSLGIVLYEMATGRVPFRGKSAIAILRQQVDTHPRPVSDARPDLPRELSDAVGLALMKRPEERPAGAAALASLLVKAGGTPELEALASGARAPGAALAASLAARPDSTAPTILDGAAALGTVPRSSVASGEETVLARRRAGRWLVLGLVALGAVLAALLGVLYERLSKRAGGLEREPSSAAGRADEPVPAAVLAGEVEGETVRRANVLARDGTVLWRNVRVVGATGEGVVIEEEDGNRRVLLYESSPTIKYLQGGGPGRTGPPGPGR